jgi:hypothetical protein
MNKIKESYSLKKIIAVADKGMNSSKKIDYLVNSGNAHNSFQALLNIFIVNNAQYNAIFAL